MHITQENKYMLPLRLFFLLFLLPLFILGSCTLTAGSKYNKPEPGIKLENSPSSTKIIPQVEINAEYKRITKQYNLLLAEKQKERENHYLLIIITISFLSFAVALVIFMSWKKSKDLHIKITNHNNEMELAVAALTETQHQNTRLMQIVAHDLKNPIASVISITSILLDNDALLEEDKELLGLMQTSSLDSIEMINNILNININPEGIVKKPEEMHRLLRYSVDLLQFKASGKNQKITLNADEATLTVSREKMWRVISNIIVNAIKFSIPGTEINVRAKKEHKEYKIIVEDRGIGIPDDIKEKVFDLFTEAKRPGTSGEQSFGLGLAISRQIIEAHGGKIWLESEEYKGTRFIISMPLS